MVVICIFLQSRSSFTEDLWNNVPITATKYTDPTSVQWNNNNMSPTNTQQWTNTATPTDTQWSNVPSSANTHWSNTVTTPSNANTQWSNTVTMPSSAQWNGNPATVNQNLEAQQARREIVMLQNENERLRRQLKQQQRQSMNINANDAWIGQQNQQLHQQVAQLTQEVQNTSIIYLL